jgi:hypothetical protein
MNVTTDGPKQGRAFLLLPVMRRSWWEARPEPKHPNEQCAVAATKSKTRWCSSQRDVELMTEKQILSSKSTPRLEQADDEHSERMQDRNHRSQ